MLEDVLTLDEACNIISRIEYFRRPDLQIYLHHRPKYYMDIEVYVQMEVVDVRNPQVVKIIKTVFPFSQSNSLVGAERVWSLISQIRDTILRIITHEFTESFKFDGFYIEEHPHPKDDNKHEVLDRRAFLRMYDPEPIPGLEHMSYD